jgi:hypothetical protein
MSSARSFSVAHHSSRGKSKKLVMQRKGWTLVDECASSIDANRLARQLPAEGTTARRSDGAFSTSAYLRGLEGRRTIMRTSLLVVLAVLAGCSSKEDSESAEAPQELQATTGGERETSAQDAMAANCPMRVDGTTVQAEQVEGGAALVFMTTGDVDALRERVRNMAAARESLSLEAQSQELGMSETMREGAGHGDATAGAKMGEAEEGISGDMPGMTEAMPVEADTRVEDIAGGARLVLIATNAADVDALRTQTEQQADIMVTGECPMTPHAVQSSGSAIVQ